MKRYVILLLVLLCWAGAAAWADTTTMIDFSKLAADTPDGQNAATIIDYSDKAGASFTAAEKKQMKTSLALANWIVTLNSSARTITNEEQSFTKEVTVNTNASQYGGEKVLGIRIHFPDEPYNAYATITPPFDIPAFMKKSTLQPDGTLKEDETDTNGSKFEGYGVVKNVGTLKSLDVDVYGSNNPNGFGVILENQNGEQQTLFCGNLDFDGWQQKTWVNPNYITDVRNRAIVRLPLYPQATPYYKLVGLIIYKDAQQPGGDTIAYVKDVSITYDKAVLQLNRDINDEAVWGILGQREEARRNAEFQKLGDLQVLRYLEQQKMDTGTVTPAAPAAAPQQ